MEPTIIGSRYEVLSSVGAGAVGALYKARDLTLKKTVAVKLLHANQVSTSSMIRFQQEARLLCQLKHTNLVTVFDFAVEESGSPYLVMEYIEGTSLLDYVRQHGPLPLPVAVSIFKDISNGLDYAHEHGILHRDLKPSNIMLVKSEGKSSHLEAKIIDFGLAKAEVNDGSEQRVTAEGAVIGSPLYVSPEQAQSKETDRRSDIYSFGCLMYYALTGAPPFRGDTGNATILMHLHDAPPTLADRLTDQVIPAELETAVEVSLRKNPEERFQTVKKLLALLEIVSEDLNKQQSDKVASIVPNATLQLQLPQSKGFEIKPPVKFAFIGAILAMLISIPFILDRIFEKEQPKPALTEALQQQSETESQSSFDSGSETFDIFSQPRLMLLVSCYRPYYNNFVEWHRALGTIDDAIVPKLFNTYPNGRYIRLLHKDISGESLGLLEARPIEALDLSACNLTAQGILVVSKIKSLHLLVLNKISSLNDADLPPLKKLTELRNISLRYNQITDEGVKTLTSFPKLEGLDITGNGAVTQASGASIMKIRKLTSLGIGHTGIDRSVLPNLIAKHQFIGLDLSGMNLDDADLELLVNEPLVIINLQDNARITNEGISKLKKIKTLVNLKLVNCQNVKESGLMALSLQCPQLEIQVDHEVIKNGRQLSKTHSTPDGASIAY